MARIAEMPRSLRAGRSRSDRPRPGRSLVIVSAVSASASPDHARLTIASMIRQRQKVVTTAAACLGNEKSTFDPPRLRSRRKVRSPACMQATTFAYLGMRSGACVKQQIPTTRKTVANIGTQPQRSTAPHPAVLEITGGAAI